MAFYQLAPVELTGIFQVHNVQTMTAVAPSALPESFAALFEESLARKEMRIGEVITAEVIRIDANHVVVNAGLKSEAYIPAEEFRSDRGEIEVKPGDFVQVAIDALEDGFGETRLSRDKAKRLAAWMDLEQALEKPESPIHHVTTDRHGRARRVECAASCRRRRV